MTTKPEIKYESGDNYKFGFITDIDTEIVPKGLNEDIIKLISQKKEEPESSPAVLFYNIPCSQKE